MNLEIREKEVKVPTICLNMIVKNESKIITRLFETVLPIIDSYCICDTGSTDNTRQIIKDYFDSKNIPGQIIRHPFKNFGHNRDYALKAAKSMADYLLFLDADMKLFIASTITFGHLLQNGNSNLAYSPDKYFFLVRRT